VPGKARVHELAKEFGVDSKTVLAKLKEQGEFVKSASSTVEAPVARRLREAFVATGGNGNGAQTAAPAARPANPSGRRLRTGLPPSPRRAGRLPARRAGRRRRGPPSPTLRANPFPEVTDPFCRLPLPTLFLSARGCSPRRPAAVMSTTERENDPLPRIFKGRRERTGRPGDRDARPVEEPHLRANRFRGPSAVVKPSRRKENSPRGSRRRLRVRSRRRKSYPRLGSGISTRFPFDRGHDPAPGRRLELPSRPGFPRPTRPDDRAAVPYGSTLPLRID